MRLSRLTTTLTEALQNSWSSRYPYVKIIHKLHQITCVRQLSKSCKLREGIAAPKIDFELDKYPGNTVNNAANKVTTSMSPDNTLYARIVPESRSYFTVQPTFTDSLVSLDQILDNYKNLPVSDPADVPKAAWLSGSDFSNMIGESVKSSRYHHMLRVLKRLHQIHPSVMPPEVEQAIKPFKREVNPEAASTKISALDCYGRSLGVGRRKTSTGRAWLVEGTGEVLVNGKTLAEAFGRIHDRETIIWPLKVTHRIGKYNLWCRVEGGGTTGQAEALTLAVAKALLGHEPALKPALRRAGCVTRDPRKVERKKPGRLKARKKPAWVKR